MAITLLLTGTLDNGLVSKLILFFWYFYTNNEVIFLISNMDNVIFLNIQCCAHCTCIKAAQLFQHDKVINIEDVVNTIIPLL